MSAKPTVTDEAWVKKQVKKILKEYSVWYFMPQAGPFGRSGIPDFICCHKGRFVAIETKARGNKPTELQLQQLRQIKTANGISLVINEHNYLKLRNLFSIDFEIVFK